MTTSGRDQAAVGYILDMSQPHHHHHTASRYSFWLPNSTLQSLLTSEEAYSPLSSVSSLAAHHDDDLLFLLQGNDTNATSTGYVPYFQRPETYIVPILFAAIFIVGVIGKF